MQDDDPIYLEWLAAAPKGVRWDKAQEMYALYQERRREQAEAVAKRLLGKQGWVTLPPLGAYPIEISEPEWYSSKR